MDLDLLRGIEEYTESRLIKNLHKTMRKFPEVNFTDAFSRNQIKSKVWLVKELKKNLGEDLGTVHILCGWYGILAAMLTDKNEFKINKIRSIDLDPDCMQVADSLNADGYKNKWQFKAFTADILELDYQLTTLKALNERGDEATITEVSDLIINTSCEHISDFESWLKLLPKGKKVVLQSNDYELHAQHTNCAESLDDFASQTNLNQILYQGELDFGDYTRFMLIGEV